jgi:hypothetical protein
VNKFYSHNGTQQVHFRVHASPSVDPISIQFLPIFALIKRFPLLSIQFFFHFVVIEGFQIKWPYVCLFSPIRATCPASLIIYDLMTLRIFDEQHKLCACSLHKCVYFDTSFTSSLLGSNIFLNSCSLITLKLP